MRLGIGCHTIQWNDRSKIRGPHPAPASGYRHSDQIGFRYGCSYTLHKLGAYKVPTANMRCLLSTTKRFILKIKAKIGIYLERYTTQHMI